MKEIFENLPFGIVIADRKKIEYINKIAKEYLGLKLEIDPINLASIQGRIGVSFEKLKDNSEIKILGNNYLFYKNIYKDKFIITIIKTEKKEDESMDYLSHEMRAPLSSMIGAIQGVLDGLFGEINEKQKNFLNIALKNSLRLKEIVEDFFFIYYN